MSWQDRDRDRDRDIVTRSYTLLSHNNLHLHLHLSTFTSITTTITNHHQPLKDTETSDTSEMPFSSFRPDGPSRGGPDRPFTPSSSFSYSPHPSQIHRPAKPSSFPRPRPQTTSPCPVHDPAKVLFLPPPLAVNLRVAATPPLLSLPTPPSSDFSPPSKNAKGSNTTTDLDENSSFDIPAEAKTPTSALLHALTPDALHALCESRESRFIFRNITPADFAAWLDLYPELDEGDTARYDYDGFSERMIIKCMAGSVHDSLPIFFIRVVTDGLQQVGPGSRRMLQVCTNTGRSPCSSALYDTC